MSHGVEFDLVAKLDQHTVPLFEGPHDQGTPQGERKQQQLGLGM